MIPSLYRYFICSIFPLLIAASDFSEEPRLKTKFGWIGLYNEEMLAWLENENHIDQLCPGSLASDERQQCRDERLRPRRWVIDVREEPALTARKLGTINITATPGVGLTAAFNDSNSYVAFIPDLFDQDWGYGPYFHQTIRDNRNSWFLLPRNPLPKPGWIDISQLTKRPDSKDVAEGLVYDLSGKGSVVTRIYDGKITIRSEQPGDMWCQDGKPPKLKPAQIRKLPFSDFFDQDGHLKLKIKYMRGC